MHFRAVLLGPPEDRGAVLLEVMMDNTFWAGAGAAATGLLAIIALLQLLIQWRKSRVSLLATIDRREADLPQHLIKISDYLHWHDLSHLYEDQSNRDETWRKLLDSARECRRDTISSPQYVIDISVHNRGAKEIRNIEIQIAEAIFSERAQELHSTCVSLPIQVPCLRPGEQHRFKTWTKSPFAAVNILQGSGKPTVRELSTIYHPSRSRIRVLFFLLARDVCRIVAAPAFAILLLIVFIQRYYSP